MCYTELNTELKEKLCSLQTKKKLCCLLARHTGGLFLNHNAVYLQVRFNKKEFDRKVSISILCSSFFGTFSCLMILLVLLVFCLLCVLFSFGLAALILIP